MRVLGLAFAGVLALTAPIAAAHAVPLGSNLKPVKSGTAPAIVQVWGGCGWGSHPVPGHWSQWRGGWVPPHCAPNRDGAGWGGPYGGWSPGPYRNWSAWQAPYWNAGPYGNSWGYP
jgi:hypothetical protein